MQLNLFSWESDQIAEGWRYAADFNFDKATQTFREVKQQHANDNELDFAIETCSKWAIYFDETWQKSEAEQSPLLFSFWKTFQFPNSWGPQLLQRALLHKIIVLANENHVFQLDETTTISDLYLKDEQPELAEKSLKDFIKKHTNTTEIQISLANIQYNLGKLTEAAQNYLEALLISPKEIKYKNIANKTLAKVIKTYGSEMTPAFAWIYGQVPMLKLNEFNEPENIKHAGIYTYYLLYMAEKYFKENNSKETLNYRKQIKENNSELFAAYFDLLKRRKIK